MKIVGSSIFWTWRPRERFGNFKPIPRPRFLHIFTFGGLYVSPGPRRTFFHHGIFQSHCLTHLSNDFFKFFPTIELKGFSDITGNVIFEFYSQKYVKLRTVENLRKFLKVQIWIFQTLHEPRQEPRENKVKWKTDLRPHRLAHLLNTSIKITSIRRKIIDNSTYQRSVFCHIRRWCRTKPRSKFWARRSPKTFRPTCLPCVSAPKSWPPCATFRKRRFLFQILENQVKTIV